jgi:hypothetical protein
MDTPALQDPFVDEELAALGDDPAKYNDRQLRAVAIDIRRSELEAKRLADLAKQVLEPYRSRIAELGDRATAARATLRTVVWTIRGGEPLRFPDVGTFYLMNKDAAAKLRLSEDGGQEAAVSHVGPDPEDLFHKVVRTFDTAAYLAHAQQVLDSTGELLPGVEKYTPEPSLAVRAS